MPFFDVTAQKPTSTGEPEESAGAVTTFPSMSAPVANLLVAGAQLQLQLLTASISSSSTAFASSSLSTSSFGTQSSSSLTLSMAARGVHSPAPGDCAHCGDSAHAVGMGFGHRALAHTQSQPQSHNALFANPNQSQSPASPQPQSPQSPQQLHCEYCGKTHSIEALKLCARCRRVCYCSKEHQRAHWPFHKTQCAPPAEPEHEPYAPSDGSSPTHPHSSSSENTSSLSQSQNQNLVHAGSVLVSVRAPSERENERERAREQQIPAPISVSMPMPMPTATPPSAASALRLATTVSNAKTSLSNPYPTRNPNRNSSVMEIDLTGEGEQLSVLPAAAPAIMQFDRLEVSADDELEQQAPAQRPPASSAGASANRPTASMFTTRPLKAFSGAGACASGTCTSTTETSAGSSSCTSSLAGAGRPRLGSGPGVGAGGGQVVPRELRAAAFVCPWSEPGALQRFAESLLATLNRLHFAVFENFLGDACAGRMLDEVLNLSALGSFAPGQTVNTSERAPASLIRGDMVTFVCAAPSLAPPLAPLPHPHPHLNADALGDSARR